MSDNYPTDVSSLLADPPMKFRAGAIRALRTVAKAKFWRRTLEEQKAILMTLNSALAAAYNVECPRLVFGIDENEADSGRSCYMPAMNIVILRGKHPLSIITCLHEWGHRLYGASEVTACKFSLQLFRRCFPQSFARLRFEGHMARKVQP